MCTVRTPVSLATSWIAKAAAELSASNRMSTPSLLTNSRAMRADSSGLPLESRTINSIGRPPRPPAALNFSISQVAPFDEAEPTMAPRPEPMVTMPALIGLFCAREMNGNPAIAVAAAAPAPLSTLLRPWPGWVRLVIVSSLEYPPVFRPGEVERNIAMSQHMSRQGICQKR